MFIQIANSSIKFIITRITATNKKIKLSKGTYMKFTNKKKNHIALRFAPRYHIL